MNSNRVFLIIGILLLIPVWCSAVDVPQDLQIVTEEFAPLNFVENGTLKGISVDLLEEALHRMGSDINRSSFRVLPWHEGYNLTLNTPDTILLSPVRLPERENLFLWAGPVISERTGLFMLNGEHTADPDFSSLRIAVVRNDSSVQYAVLAGAGKENLIEVPTGEEAVHLVENRSVDGWVYGQIAGQRYIDQYATDPSRFVFAKDLGSSEKYFGFNRNTPVEFVNNVNKTLQELKTDRSITGVSPFERIVARYLPVGCANSSITKEQVVNLVTQTVVGIKTDAPGTIAAINAGESPYRDPVNPDLYAFVFDTNVTLIANAVNQVNIGGNLSGTTDVTGKPFRDELVKGAIKDGSGWVTYAYSNPGSLGLFEKSSYYQRVTGSDGKEYVVGSGRYLTCSEITKN